MYIDTHSHLNFNAFRDDVDIVIKRALDDDVQIIIASTNYKSSKRALEIANKYQRGVNVAVGLHPTNLEDVIEKYDGKELFVSAEEFNSDIYQQLAKFKKVVAIGEIGLDYFRRDLHKDMQFTKEQQKSVLWAQLKLAANLDLPVILHCRDAHDDMVALLTKFKNEFIEQLPKNRPWGVLHCFSGDEDLAWQYFNLGLIISFTGLITFSKQWDDLIRKVPNDKLMIETDCPFMTPEPYRGKRNEPVLVKYVAKRMAEIKGIGIEEIEQATTENARRIFRI
jgi:TatD DNase family protein